MACNVVPQPTAPPRVPNNIITQQNIVVEKDNLTFSIGMPSNTSAIKGKRTIARTKE
jgi:hypothetical protein